MAVELPEPLQWVLLLLAGTRWPEGDEDLMRDMGRRWRATAEALDEAGRASDAAVRRALDGQQGSAAEALEKDWNKLVLPADGSKPGFFPGMVKSCNAMADSLEAMANSTETAKISIVAQLGILAFEIATAEAAAPVTAGASMAAIAPAIQVSKMTVQQILKKLAKEIIEYALKEAFQEVAINLLAQSIQLASGNRKELDGKELGMSAAGGAIGGAAGGMIGKGLGAAGGKLIGKKMDTLPAQMVEGALTDVGADVVTQLALTGEVDGSGLGGSALSGAGSPAIMRGASAVKGKFNSSDIPDASDFAGGSDAPGSSGSGSGSSGSSTGSGSSGSSDSSGSSGSSDSPSSSSTGSSSSGASGGSGSSGSTASGGSGNSNSSGSSSSGGSGNSNSSGSSGSHGSGSSSKSDGWDDSGSSGSNGSGGPSRSDGWEGSNSPGSNSSDTPSSSNSDGSGGPSKPDSHGDTASGNQPNLSDVGSDGHNIRQNYSEGTTPDTNGNSGNHSNLSDVGSDGHNIRQNYSEDTPRTFSANRDAVTPTHDTTPYQGPTPTRGETSPQLTPYEPPTQRTPDSTPDPTPTPRTAPTSDGPPAGVPHQRQAPDTDQNDQPAGTRVAGVGTIGTRTAPSTPGYAPSPTADFTPPQVTPDAPAQPGAPAPQHTAPGAGPSTARPTGPQPTAQPSRPVGTNSAEPPVNPANTLGNRPGAVPPSTDTDTDPDASPDAPLTEWSQSLPPTGTVPDKDAMAEYGRILGMEPNQLPQVMVFAPTGATASTPFSQYSSGVVNLPLTEAGHRLNLSLLSGGPEIGNTADATQTLTGLGGGAYVASMDGRPEALAINQTVDPDHPDNRDGWTQEEVIQHELGHHQQVLDGFDIDPRTNNVTLIEYHNILTNEARFDRPNPRVFYVGADGQGNLQLDQKTSIELALGINPPARLAPAGYWDAAVQLPKNPNEQRMFDGITAALGAPPYAGTPAADKVGAKARKNFAKAYLQTYATKHPRERPPAPEPSMPPPPGNGPGHGHGGPPLPPPPPPGGGGPSGPPLPPPPPPGNRLGGPPPPPPPPGGGGPSGPPLPPPPPPGNRLGGPPPPPPPPGTGASARSFGPVGSRTDGSSAVSRSAPSAPGSTGTPPAPFGDAPSGTRSIDHATDQPHSGVSDTGSPAPSTESDPSYRPATDGRPQGSPGGLVDPSDLDHQRINNAVPHGPDGRPQVHPDPNSGNWHASINGDGPRTPGRNNNCVDVALAAVDTYSGHPTAAASRTSDLDDAGRPSNLGERNGRDRIENSLGAKFSDYGDGSAAFNRLENKLRQSGHGSQAVIITSDTDGRSHVWNVVNHNGKITYIDAQTGHRSDKPLHNGENGVFAIPLDPDRKPSDVAPDATDRPSSEPGLLEDAADDDFDYDNYDYDRYDEEVEYDDSDGDSQSDDEVEYSDSDQEVEHSVQEAEHGDDESDSPNHVEEGDPSLSEFQPAKDGIQKLDHKTIFYHAGATAKTDKLKDGKFPDSSIRKAEDRHWFGFYSASSPNDATGYMDWQIAEDVAGLKKARMEPKNELNRLTDQGAPLEQIRAAQKQIVKLDAQIEFREELRTEGRYNPMGKKKATDYELLDVQLRPDKDGFDLVTFDKATWNKKSPEREQVIWEETGKRLGRTDWPPHDPSIPLLERLGNEGVAVVGPSAQESGQAPRFEMVTPYSLMDRMVLAPDPVQPVTDGYGFQLSEQQLKEMDEHRKRIAEPAGTDLGESSSSNSAPNDQDGPTDGQDQGQDQEHEQDQDQEHEQDQDQDQDGPDAPEGPLTTEHSLAADPKTFFTDNLVFTNVDAGLVLRHGDQFSSSERANLQKLVDGQTNHWFTMVPDPVRSTADKPAYVLTPALEKYAEVNSEIRTLIGNRPLPPAGPDADYLQSGYIPFKVGAPATVTGSDGVQRIDLGKIGHADIPLSGDGTSGPSKLVVTPTMNGCALAVTPSARPGHITAWHYQSPNGNVANTKAALFRRDQRPTDWFGWEEYESADTGDSDKTKTFEVTNTLWQDSDGGWHIVSQENREDKDNEQVSTVRTRPLKLTPGTEGDQAAQVARIYAGLAQKELGEFDRAATKLLAKPYWTPAGKQEVADQLGMFRQQMEAQRDALRTMAGMDSTAPFTGSNPVAMPPQQPVGSPQQTPGNQRVPTTFADLESLAAQAKQRRTAVVEDTKAMLSAQVVAGLGNDWKQAGERQQTVDDQLKWFTPEDRWLDQLTAEVTAHPAAHDAPAEYRPATAYRPSGSDGLMQPTEADQARIDGAVPRVDGAPVVHPSPYEGGWIGAVNGDGPTAPGRGNNCVDVALSIVDTYLGRPTAAAPRTPPSPGGEAGGRDRIESSLGAKFADLGSGREAFDRLESTLRQSGHGSQAVIITTDADGRAHAWNAVNHNGQVTYIDGQTGQRSDQPLHSGDEGVFAIPLDPDRAPITPDHHTPDSTHNRTAPERPGATSHVNPPGRSAALTFPRLDTPPGPPLPDGPERRERVRANTEVTKVMLHLESFMRQAAGLPVPGSMTMLDGHPLPFLQDVPQGADLPEAERLGWEENGVLKLGRDRDNPDVTFNPATGEFTTRLDPTTLNDRYYQFAGKARDLVQYGLRRTGDTSMQQHAALPPKDFLREYGLTRPESQAYWQAQDARVSELDASAKRSVRERPKLLNAGDVDGLLMGQVTGAGEQAGALLGKYDGFVLGENHNDQATWTFLAEQMPALSRSGVKTVYLEHFRDDALQDELNQFMSSTDPRPRDPLALAISRHERTYKFKADSVLNTIVAARTNRIGVQLVDGFPARMPPQPPDRAPIPQGEVKPEIYRRTKRMNSYTVDVIDRHQKKSGVGAKYVVVLGSAHVGEHKGQLSEGMRGKLGIRKSAVPGVAEALGVPGVAFVREGNGDTVVEPLNLHQIPRRP
ncbi:toxin glutamine deamidase domain-containing protein [Kitasatospora sp. NPDC101801]|uniref:toxin glutamine deamidase domain-containing protein n=1 Tax=Kitasatospora sp. NPDC101801 TaxID=3364103 RepID=UPI00380626EF